jgi:excisionase family DNA binding protein
VSSSVFFSSRSTPVRPLRVSETATRLNVTEATVRRWVRDGLLPARRLGPGRRILIDPDDLGRLFSNATPEPPTSDEDRAGSVQRDPGEIAS